MTASDDEYGFDDLVLDDRALAVLDATERNFTTTNSHAPITRPRSSPERQPTKRLKTNQGWVPRHGRQEREMSPAPRGLTRPRFSLEDTDLPEITISNGFYSGPGRFFVGSSQSQPSASPNTLQDNREPLSGTDSDVVLLPTPTVRHVHAPERNIAAPSNRQLRVSPPVPPSIVSVPGTERSIRSVAALGSGNPPPRDPSPARASPLTRSSSFSDPMRVALHNAIFEANSQALQRSTSTTASSGTPSPLSAGPQAYAQRPPLSNQTQVVVHSRREHPARPMRRERSLPPTQRLQPRQPSPHQPTGSQHQSTPRERHASPIGEVSSLRDELESLRSEMEEVRFSHRAPFPFANPTL